MLPNTDTPKIGKYVVYVWTFFLHIWQWQASLFGSIILLLPFLAPPANLVFTPPNSLCHRAGELHAEVIYLVLAQWHVHSRAHTCRHRRSHRKHAEVKLQLWCMLITVLVRNNWGFISKGTARYTSPTHTRTNTHMTVCSNLSDTLTSLAVLRLSCPSTYTCTQNSILYQRRPLCCRSV